MRKATATFTSVPGSELFFGRPITTPKESGETHDQHDERTWKEKVHQDEEGKIFLQPFCLKNALESSGKWLSMKIPGGGQKTYTKKLVSGTLVVDRMWLTDHDGKQLMIDDVVPKRLFVPSDGKRGGSKRVYRTFPSVPQWKCEGSIHVVEDLITVEVLQKHLEAVGSFIGFGSMRVENGGINGRFNVSDLVVG